MGSASCPRTQPTDWCADYELADAGARAACETAREEVKGRSSPLLQPYSQLSPTTLTRREIESIRIRRPAPTHWQIGASITILADWEGQGKGGETGEDGWIN
jgi:hypothetical protein